MEEKEPVKRRVGRPRRDAAQNDMRQIFIDAAVDIMKNQGAEQVTVRNVCEKAGASVGTYYHYFKNKDDLLSHFVSESAYGPVLLHTPFTDLAGRMFELWSHLIRIYQSLGVEFTQHYYNCENIAISAYGSAKGKKYQGRTLLERSRQELEQAQAEGFLTQDADPFYVTADLCDIIKGCVFEWCLCKGDMALVDTARRIMTNYMIPISVNQAAAV